MAETAKQKQHELNVFTERYLRGVAPLQVDGKIARATNTRIRTVKYYLGYGKRGSKWNSEFVRKLRHPHSVRYSPPWQLAVAARRRARQRRLFAINSQPRTGVVTFDGRPVAAWMVPHLQFARAHGWSGVLVSGHRDPAYSEHLCYSMCGAPRCAGRCAGRASHHAQSDSPNGAIDVSDYITFGHLMARPDSPTPKIYNSLPNDPVHFSSTGN